MTKPDDIPLFPLRTNAEVWLTGRWKEGGFALLRDEDSQQLLPLPCALFAVLAVLIQAGQRQESDSGPMQVDGFLSIDQLRAQIRHWTDGRLEPEREHVVRFIYRLRAKLRTWGDHWGDALLEHQDGLGYRLSTPADNLHLKLLD